MVVRQIIGGQPTMDQVKHDETTMPEHGKSDKLGVKMGKTCTDVISRQGMCDSLNKYRIEKMLEGKDVSLVWECIDKVLQEPSAQPEQRWIPVSEEMPTESDGTVLVCMPDESPYNEQEPFINAKHNQQVETAHYSQYSDTWYFAMGAVSETRPIAWMPLPEPFKEAEK